RTGFTAGIEIFDWRRGALAREQPAFGGNARIAEGTGRHPDLDVVAAQHAQITGGTAANLDHRRMAEAATVEIDQIAALWRAAQRVHVLDPDLRQDHHGTLLDISELAHLDPH